MKVMRLAPLMGLMTISWIVILVETYLLFRVIIPYGRPIHELGAFALQSLGKVALVAVLGIGWFAVMFFWDYLYSRTKQR
jgi:hypothetical protein